MNKLIAKNPTAKHNYTKIKRSKSYENKGGKRNT